MTPQEIPEHARVEIERNKKMLNDRCAQYLAQLDEIFGIRKQKQSSNQVELPEQTESPCR